MERRLGFFVHIARSAPDEDHHRAVAAAICKPPSDWKRPPGRSNHTWLRVIELELRPLNIGTVTRGRKQPLENTGVRLWTGLRSRRVGLCHAEMPRRESGGCVALNRRRLRSHRQNRELIVVYSDDVMVCGAVMGKSQIKYLPQISNV